MHATNNHISDKFNNDKKSKNSRIIAFFLNLTSLEKTFSMYPAQIYYTVVNLSVLGRVHS